MKKITALVLVLVLALSFALTSFATATPPTYLSKFNNETATTTLAVDNGSLPWGQAYLLNGYYFDYKSGTASALKTENPGTAEANSYIENSDGAVGSDFALYPASPSSLSLTSAVNLVVSFKIRFNTETPFSADNAYLELFSARSNRSNGAGGGTFQQPIRINNNRELLDEATKTLYYQIPVGEWTQIAMVFNTGTLKYSLYVDGVSYTTEPVASLGYAWGSGAPMNPADATALFKEIERIKVYVLQAGKCAFDMDDVEMYIADEPYVENPDTGSIGLTVFAVITSVAGIGIIGTTAYLRKKSAKAAK